MGLDSTGQDYHQSEFRGYSGLQLPGSHALINGPGLIKGKTLPEIHLLFYFLFPINVTLLILYEDLVLVKKISITLLLLKAVFSIKKHEYLIVESLSKRVLKNHTQNSLLNKIEYDCTMVYIHLLLG